LSNNYTDIASCKIGVNRQWTTDGRTDNEQTDDQMDNPKHDALC